MIPPVKITRPRLPGVVQRKRLFRVLDRARKRPIVWVTGPSGCGKTTLVSSYLSARKLPHLWYRLDKGDADPATFFHYLRLAAGKTGKRGIPLPALTPEYLPNLPGFTRRYFELLFGRLPRPCAIVLDYDLDLESASALHDLLGEALTSIPPKINIVIIGRGTPPDPFARFEANRLLSLVGWGELQLTPPEVREMIRLKHPGRVSDKAVRMLHRETNGWAAGVVLMLERTTGRGLEEALLAGKVSEAVFGYFAGEIFERAPGDTRTVMMQTAVLPFLTARMAEQLTGRRDAGRMLAAFARRHYFVDTRPGSEPVYQYHALFRKFLLEQGRSLLSPGKRARLLRRAADVLEAHGHIEESLTLYHEVRDWAGMTRLILTAAPGLAAQGRLRILEEWLTRFPRTWLDNTPWLEYWLGICRLFMDPSQSRRRFEKGFAEFLKQGDPAGFLAAWSGPAWRTAPSESWRRAITICPPGIIFSRGTSPGPRR